jgi:glutamine synthetase
MDGVDRRLQPPPRDDAPYAAGRTLLPASLSQALDALEGSTLYRKEFGEVFTTYFLRLKRSELGRYRDFLEKNSLQEGGESVTEWEQNEYFDFF